MDLLSTKSSNDRAEDMVSGQTTGSFLTLHKNVELGRRFDR